MSHMIQNSSSQNFFVLRSDFVSFSKMNNIVINFEETPCERRQTSKVKLKQRYFSFPEFPDGAQSFVCLFVL